MHRWRCITFDDWFAKAQYLDGVAWVDARILPKVREVSRRIAAPYGAISPEKYPAIASDLYRLVKDRVVYVSDPASEEFSDAQQTLEQGFGDCDDKVRCFVALCRCLKLEAHVRPVMRAGEFTHVQAQVRWPGSDRLVRPGSAARGVPPTLMAEDGWITAELILRDGRLGDEVQDVPVPAGMSFRPLS